MDGLLHIAFCAHFAVGGVGVGGADVAGGAVDFADVLGQIPAVGVPGGVFLDGQRARGDGLGRVPGDEPERRMRGAREITAGDLQVAAVEVALVQRDIAVHRDLLRGAAAHGIIFAVDACAAAAVHLREVRRAVLGIVADGPDAGAGLHARLVAIRIVGGDAGGASADVMFFLRICIIHAVLTESQATFADKNRFTLN